MAVVSKLVALVKAFDRKVWPDHRVAMGQETIELLSKHNLVVADVGSAGGPQEIWLSLRQYIHFLTFEPNLDASQPGRGNRTTNFPIGLWSEKGKRELYITKHSDSASLMQINDALFADFLIKDGMEVIRTATIELDTLDQLLADKPELLPDFLKIDVEGADLEVLKGSRQALARSILGLRVETSFLELHLGAPLLWDIDVFLREQGFVLFHLGHNHWIRNNGLHGFSSAPQLIWGDAVYFLTRESFLKRLAARQESERPALLTKFVVVLLRHGIHDYSWEIIEAAHAAKLVTNDLAVQLKKLVEESLDSSIWYFVKGGLGVGFALLVLLFSLPLAEPRKRGVYYLKQRAGRLFYDLWRSTALEGPKHGCVGDHVV